MIRKEFSSAMASISKPRASGDDPILFSFVRTLIM